jgi:hypothetical protein
MTQYLSQFSYVNANPIRVLPVPRLLNGPQPPEAGNARLPSDNRDDLGGIHQTLAAIEIV